MSKYGFNDKLHNVHIIDKIYDLIWNDCILYNMKDNKEIYDINEIYFHTLGKALVVYPNNVMEKKEVQELNKKLYKDFRTYVSKVFCFMNQNTFDNLIEKDKKKQEEKIKKQKEVLKQQQKKENRGIYGLLENGQIVYIGYTNRSFQIREKEHREKCKQKSNELWLYKELNEDFEFKPLIDISKLEADSEITLRDIKTMEFALISLYKPKYNIAGVKVPYKYSN